MTDELFGIDLRIFTVVATILCCSFFFGLSRRESESAQVIGFLGMIGSFFMGFVLILESFTHTSRYRTQTEIFEGTSCLYESGTDTRIRFFDERPDGYFSLRYAYRPLRDGTEQMMFLYDGSWQPADEVLEEICD